MAHGTSSPTVRRLAGVHGLIDLLDAARLQHAGEAVDVLTHGLQCAALLERRAPDDLELQVAGLVHDIGNVVDDAPVGHHADLGADLLRPVLGDRVARLVGGHELAKRYLVTIDARYRDRLSPASREQLRIQGGLMDPDERAGFLARTDADALVALRRADDDALDPQARVPGLEHWTLALYAVAATARPGDRR